MLNPVPKAVVEITNEMVKMLPNSDKNKAEVKSKGRNVKTAKSSGKTPRSSSRNTMVSRQKSNVSSKSKK